MSDEDKKALYYVGGFVVKKLKTIYYKSSAGVLEFIASLQVDESNHAASSWTRALNLKNLVMISDDFFEFVVEAETLCHKALASNSLRNCFLSDFLLDICSESSTLANMWERLSASSDSEFKGVMIQSLTIFCKTRSKAYVNYLNRELSIITSSASLRQSLVKEKKSKSIAKS